MPLPKPWHLNVDGRHVASEGETGVETVIQPL